MGKLLLFTGIAALSAFPQVPPHPKWLQEPDNFKSVKFLDSTDAAKEHVPAIECMTPMAGLSHGRCVLMIDLPGARQGLKVHFIFINDKMRSVTGSFPSSSFSDVKDVFVEKYGKPTLDQTGEVQTGFGVKYQQEMMTWIGEKVTILLQKYSSTVNEGSVFIALVDDINQQIRDKEAQKRSVLQ